MTFPPFRLKGGPMQLTLAAIQFHPTEAGREENLQCIEKLVEAAAAKKAKLILLPETCDLGYDLQQIQSLAEPFPNRTTTTLSEIARRYRVVLVAGLVERRMRKIYNTAVVIDPSGEIVAQYDKSHLCPIPPLDESSIFEPGNRLVVTDVLGIKIGITICYDVRFPEIYRKLALGGVQLIVHPTAFPRSRIEQFEVCLRARAIENQIFAMSANQCGNGGACEFGGHSLIVGPSGEVLAQASDTDEAVITATAEFDEIEQVRREKPVFTQRRPELY